MVFRLENFIGVLDSLRILDVALPFLLFFIVSFAFLQIINPFGDKKKKFNIFIALAISLILVIPHMIYLYPENYDIIDIINGFLPGISLLVLFLLVILVVIISKLIKKLGNEDEINLTIKKLSKYLGIFTIIAIIWIFGAAAGWWVGWEWFTNFFGADAVTMIIILLFPLLICCIIGYFGWLGLLIFSLIMNFILTLVMGLSNLIQLALGIFSLIAGICLWGRTKAAILIAKIYLGILLVVGLFTLNFYSIVYSIFWLLYLYKSKRIKNFYVKREVKKDIKEEEYYYFSLPKWLKRKR
jgi:hypothetical protein